MEKVLQAARDTMRAFENEVHGDSLSSTAFESAKRTLAQMDADVARYSGELARKKPRDKRSELMSGARGVENTTAPLDVAAAIQQRDLELLNNAAHLLEAETCAVAENIMTALHEQGEELERAQVDLNAVDDSLKRSKATLRRVARRLAGDKVMWLLIFLVLAAVVFIVVWVVTHPGASGVDTIFGNRTISII